MPASRSVSLICYTKNYLQLTRHFTVHYAKGEHYWYIAWCSFFRIYMLLGHTILSGALPEILRFRSGILWRFRPPALWASIRCWKDEYHSVGPCNAAALVGTLKNLRKVYDIDRIEGRHCRWLWRTPIISQASNLKGRLVRFYILPLFGYLYEIVRKVV